MTLPDAPALPAPGAPAEVPALLAEVLAALPVAVVVTDARGRIMFANREAGALFGYDAPALAGQPVEVLVPTATRPGHAALHQAFLREPVPRPMGANLDLTAQRADGRLVPVEVALKPIEGADGPMVICTVVDISTRKALERQGREANAELERRVLERTAQLEQSNLELERARAELERLSREDPLTGLANRREFDARVELELRRSQRHDVPISFAMLDLDFFKRVNDRWGHALGDEVLRRIGGILRQQCRGVDIVARHGGEEFALALPDTGLDDALALCERIRAAVDWHPWAQLQPGLQVTLSIGVAQRQPGEPVHDALARADACMYAAKRQGRNRVESDATAPAIYDNHPWG
jgi:diguanylate cyclase (GGDEF)-like protein/PAS domain S-box-containing protein